MVVYMYMFGSYTGTLFYVVIETHIDGAALSRY